MELLFLLPLILALVVIGPIVLVRGLVTSFREGGRAKSVEATVRGLIREHAGELADHKRKLVYADGRGVLRMEGWQHHKRRFHADVVVTTLGDTACEPSLVDIWIEEEITSSQLHSLVGRGRSLRRGG